MCFVSLSNAHSSELAPRNLEIRPLDELRWRLTQASFNALLLEQSGLWSKQRQILLLLHGFTQTWHKEVHHGNAFGYVPICQTYKERMTEFSLNHLSGHRNSSRETSENGSVDRTIQTRCTPNCHKILPNAGTNLHPYGIVGLDCLDPQLRSIRHTTRPSSTMTIYCVYNLFLLHSSAMIIYNY